MQKKQTKIAGILLVLCCVLALIVFFQTRPAHIFRKNSSVLFWSILSGFFGLAFGALCALPYLAAGGIGAAIAYWTSGLLFDVTHCVGNFVVCLVLFRPLRSLLAWLYTGQHAL